MVIHSKPINAHERKKMKEKEEEAEEAMMKRKKKCKRIETIKPLVSR